MNINTIWQGQEYPSSENCVITITESGTEVTSTIVASVDGITYDVRYTIKTNTLWQTTFCEIICRQENELQTIRLEGDGQGNWKYGGQDAPHFKGCTDVDISLTPFTNTLPIRRLALAENETAEIAVIYCHLPEKQVVPVRQQYTRVSRSAYHYQNVPNDFEATIEVDELGLATNYPPLFSRKAIDTWV